MLFVRAFLGGMIGGLVGSAVWAALGYFFHIQIGWLAWGVGALAGIGALKLSGRDGEPLIGAAAVLAAMLSVTIGKYGTVYFVSQQFFSTLSQATQDPVTDDTLIVLLAEEELDRIQEMGKSSNLQWPAGMDRESASAPGDYPRNVETAARAKLKAMPNDERETWRAKVEADTKMFIAAAPSFTFDVFLASFTIFDILWFILAAVTSYKIGAADDTN